MNLSLCKAILIAEDNDDTRSFLELALKSAGYRVESASNGTQALQKLKELKTPTLILLDIMMPQMSGWDFLKQKERKGHRVITISAVNANTLDELGEWNEVDAKMQKPLFLADILSLVEKFCETIHQPAHPIHP